MLDCDGKTKLHEDLKSMWTKILRLLCVVQKGKYLSGVG